MKKLNWFWIRYILITYFCCTVLIMYNRKTESFSFEFLLSPLIMMFLGFILSLAISFVLGFSYEFLKSYLYYKSENKASNPFVIDEVFIIINFWVTIFYCFIGKYLKGISKN